ncbi:transposable element Tcb1 transposase [Rhizophagus clarus]|uniref:Transposable element Tcb1 transposase n=1 Tax=Rhizophagus clarus TaxID=94130 RepID=A0A8H3KWX0_9GLOM|nr:transposable element Tcb1 transposase [Rhizophagus clarus]
MPVASKNRELLMESTKILSNLIIAPLCPTHVLMTHMIINQPEVQDKTMASFTSPAYGSVGGGHSEQNIEEILDHSKTTIHDIITNYKNSQQITAEDWQQSLDEITKKISESLSIFVCSSTIKSALYYEGFFGQAGKRKPLVSEANRKKRLEWCYERRNWDTEWDSVIWSDEKYDVDCLIPTVKSENQGVMVWGCFTKDKLDPLVQVSSSITGDVYINLLENTFLPFYNSLDDDLEYIFQDDNAPVHRARTEGLGAQTSPKNIGELMEVLVEKWDKIEPEVLVNLVESMPRRVQAIIDSHGNPTRY